MISRNLLCKVNDTLIYLTHYFIQTDADPIHGDSQSPSRASGL